MSRPATWIRSCHAKSCHCSALFNDVGVSVLIASHDLQLIGELDYPVLSLAQGRLVQPGADAA